MIPTLHIHLLGDFLLTTDETPVTRITIPRLQSLFAYLVLHRNVPQDRSHLAFLLWPDFDGSAGICKSTPTGVSLASNPPQY